MFLLFLSVLASLCSGGVAQTPFVDPGIPVISNDFQVTFVVNQPSVNESLSIEYIHAGSMGVSRVEFQSGNDTYVHIAETLEQERIDIITPVNGLFWNCSVYPLNVQRGFGEAGMFPGDYIDDLGWVPVLFGGTQQSFNTIFNVGPPNIETYNGQALVRGILCDNWTTTFTQLRGMTGLVTRAFYFSAAGIDVDELNEWNPARVPVRMTVSGTLNNQPIFWLYDFVKFLPMLPSIWHRQALFGDCFTIRNVATAELGDDDDDHHDSINVPALPTLPQNFTMLLEVNMFTHNTSFLIKYWQYGNQSRVEYESGGVWWTDIMDGVAGLRYEFPTASPLSCTQVPLNSPMPFGGEPPGVLAPNKLSSMWNGKEDDDDDLIEELFYRVAMAHQTLYQLFTTNLVMQEHKGQQEVRGIRCDEWSTTMTITPFWLNQSCNLEVDFFISAPGVEFDGAYFDRVPVEIAIDGTIGALQFVHKYSIVGFLSYTPNAREQIGMFGNCSQQQLVDNALNNVVAPPQLPNASPGFVVLAFVVGIVLGAAVAVGVLCFRQRAARKAALAKQAADERTAASGDAKHNVPLE